MTNYLNFRLKIQQISEHCQFELSWGKGQQIKPILVNYPHHILQSYQIWQRAYLRYYQHNARGRVVNQGGLSEINPRTKLIESETKLLTDLKTWLSREELSKIRLTIAEVIKKWAKQKSIHPLNIFLTCSSLELERLPWEAWELDNEIASPVTIRITRTTHNIRSDYALKTHQRHRKRARILAIFGDQTGLDFQKDLEALLSLSSLAEIQTVTLKEDHDISQYQAQICQKLAEQKGWDILLFTGHSDENALLGGELGIAPKISLSLQELEPYLRQAQANGLQFSLFNSCKGLDIAHTLIDWGFNQVAIMREPIQNSVAQAFLVEFLKALAQEKDVNDALVEACQSLKNRLDYPSAYLIPSLFAHPEAPFYQIESVGWKAQLKQWLPLRRQAIALSSLLLISLLTPVQEFLLDKRTLVQAIYRDLTHQLPQNMPPVLLISLDEESFNQAKISDRNPLDRQYLSAIIEQVSLLNPQVIGIDYLLDRPQGENDQILSKTLQDIIQKNKTLFIFAATLIKGKEQGINPEIATLNSVMQGSITGSPLYLSVPDDCLLSCPFSYLIAVSQVVYPLVNLTHPKDLKAQTLQQLKKSKIDDSQSHFLEKVYLHPLTQISAYFRQRWLQPIIDYSLPPENIYDSVPAWQLLEGYEHSLDNPVILIASGGYAEAGIDGKKDYFDAPLSLRFWHLKAFDSTNKLTGGEAHAYMIHHWLNQHLVIPIPSIWLMLIAALLGKAVEQKLVFSASKPKRLIGGFLGMNIGYILLSLQAYITLHILIPWLLPSVTFWLYFLLSFRKFSHEK